MYCKAFDPISGTYSNETRFEMLYAEPHKTGMSVSFVSRFTFDIDVQPTNLQIVFCAPWTDTNGKRLYPGDTIYIPELDNDINLNGYKTILCVNGRFMASGENYNINLDDIIPLETIVERYSFSLVVD